MSPEAQAKFKELMDLLKGRMMESVSKEMRDRLKNLTPEQMAAMREMLRQLNQMMKDKASGRQPDFQSFMQQFGPLFGPNPPQSLEELLERLQRSAAQMQSLLDSMSPEARRELFEALTKIHHLFLWRGISGDWRRCQPHSPHHLREFPGRGWGDPYVSLLLKAACRLPAPEKGRFSP
jgi:uncharacterized protein Yka (UPF0111/DUF47 family)